MKWPILIAVVLAVAGCSGRVEKDDRPASTIDRTQTFWLEFGRGSGLDGLETIKLDQTGRVVLYRVKSGAVLSWKVATLQIQPEAVSEVLRAVDSNRLMGLQKEYHANIHDGTQWVLWMKQGKREKSVYFNNNFPQAITKFAEQLDAILGRAGLKSATWHAVPERESGQHDKELWDSIRR